MENVSCHVGLSKDANAKNIREERQNNEEKQNSRLTENAQIVSGNSSCSQNSMDKYYRQKGPRVAKVVRRINCNAELLEFGIVQPGQAWCDSRAVYPKGFRSRVKYINISDPTDMCYYICQIQDAGQDRPLFMVSLEKCENEVFIRLSAARCWEMVRERVNHEITKQHKLGRLKLHSLQPPGSLDGMEMFGFTSPFIVQRIQTMDRHRLCKEYWKSRPFHSQYNENNENSPMMIPGPNNPNVTRNNSLQTRADTTMASLFEKASLEELNILQNFMFKGDSTANRTEVARLLNEEIQKRPR